jgi:hypothetical protein
MLDEILDAPSRKPRFLTQAERYAVNKWCDANRGWCAQHTGVQLVEECSRATGIDLTKQQLRTTLVALNIEYVKRSMVAHAVPHDDGPVLAMALHSLLIELTSSDKYRTLKLRLCEIINRDAPEHSDA